MVSSPGKNIYELGLLFPIYGRIKHVPKHQPDKFVNSMVPSFHHWTIVLCSGGGKGTIQLRKPFTDSRRQTEDQPFHIAAGQVWILDVSRIFLEVPPIFNVLHAIHQSKSNIKSLESFSIKTVNGERLTSNSWMIQIWPVCCTGVGLKSNWPSLYAPPNQLGIWHICLMFTFLMNRSGPRRLKAISDGSPDSNDNCWFSLYTV